MPPRSGLGLGGNTDATGICRGQVIRRARRVAAAIPCFAGYPAAFVRWAVAALTTTSEAARPGYRTSQPRPLVQDHQPVVADFARSAYSDPGGAGDVTGVPADADQLEHQDQGDAQEERGRPAA